MVCVAFVVVQNVYYYDDSPSLDVLVLCDAYHMVYDKEE